MARPKEIFQAARFALGLGAVFALALMLVFAGPEVNAMKRPPSSNLLFVDRWIPEGRMLAIKIPAGTPYWVVPAMTPPGQVQEAAAFAKQYQALAVINAGYFDPNNRQTTSFVLTPSQDLADPTQNKRMMESKALQPYLKQILNRSEWRVLRCASEKITYQIALANDALPESCRLVARVGGGPRLLPELEKGAEAGKDILQERFKREGFVDSLEEGDRTKLTRDPIGVNQPNARSAVGLTEAGDVWLVMVAQQNPPKSNDSKSSLAKSFSAKSRGRGVSLQRLAALMQELGVHSALNLDGGTSSQLWYQGQQYIGKVRPDGEPVTRKVKSVLMVVPF